MSPEKLFHELLNLGAAWRVVEITPHHAQGDTLLGVPGQTSSPLSSSLLDSPGAVVAYKVYAITGDERENDSKPATVQWPAV